MEPKAIFTYNRIQTPFYIFIVRLTRMELDIILKPPTFARRNVRQFERKFGKLESSELDP